MSARRARIYDGLALLIVIVVVALDEWTKALVVQYLSPPYTHAPIPLIGQYLTIYYVQNSGAAFGMFSNSYALTILIALAICLIAYLYIRMLNTGTLAFKLVFGLIIGGAAGNLLDRALRGGQVVDFIFFRIPQIGYQFAVFNLADSAISVGVFLLLVLLLFGSLRRPKGEDENTSHSKTSSTSQPTSGTLQPREQDAQS